MANPQSEDDYHEYDYEDVCLTSADSEDPEKECVFPFTFNNFTYHGCPTDPIDEKKRWCSTKTDENGVHITGTGTWGYCTSGCHPEIFPDELLIGADAEKDTQTETCDYTSCNGFTFKLDVFDKVETYGQCQFPAGENGATDDYFCFVNEDSACKDKAPYGDEEEGLLVTTLACKDKNAPAPRIFGFLKGFIKGFFGSNRRGRSYGRNRYSHGSSHHHQHKQTCQTVYKEHCTYEHKQECQHVYKTVTTYQNKRECKTVYKKEKKCQTTYKEECGYDNQGSLHSGDYSDYDGINPRLNLRRSKRDEYSRKKIKCKKVPHRDCKHVNVPDTQCQYVKVPNRSQVPEKKCHHVKVPKCHKVPEKKCHNNSYKPRKRYGSRHKSHHSGHYGWSRG